MEAYEEAALRHYNDAAFLEEGKRLDNADHLFGISAECGVKAALLEHGRPFVSPSTQRLDEHYRTHIDVLWDRAKLQQLASRQMYSVLEMANPFADWKVDQRYAATDSVTPDRLDKHKRAAHRVLGAAGLLGTRRGNKR